MASRFTEALTFPPMTTGGVPVLNAYWWPSPMHFSKSGRKWPSKPGWWKVPFQAESLTGPSAKFNPGVVDAIVKSGLDMFDRDHGGFGQAPKFPHPAALDLLIEQYSRSRDDRLRSVFVTTLEKMAKGGVYDQLAGGFHRYSVDERWVVPHFEKMSYDNSELLKNYVHAYQATGSQFFADVARDIVRWMDEWLSDRERGGFYASQDADISMDDDGHYFTCTLY